MSSKAARVKTLVITALLPMIGFGQKDQPNVLIIMTDQQRWDAMGYAGNAEIKTPNMDRLAKEGVYFQISDTKL
jgi:hypothetical protein